MLSIGAAWLEQEIEVKHGVGEVDRQHVNAAVKAGCGGFSSCGEQIERFCRHEPPVLQSDVVHPPQVEGNEENENDGGEKSSLKKLSR